MKSLKNKMLLSTYVISLLPTIFYGRLDRYNLGIFIERSTRIDFYVMYYCIAIDFLIMAYCLHYSKGIDRRVSRLILVITVLDLVHLLLVAKQGFGLVKIGLAITVVVCYEIFKKKYADSKSSL